MGFIKDSTEFRDKYFGTKFYIFFVLFTSALLFIIYQGILSAKSSEVYMTSIERAKKNQEIIHLLGEPIEDGFSFSGTVPTSSSETRADFSVHLSGPQASGVLKVEAIREKETWVYQKLSFKNQNQTINLLVE